MYIRNYNPRKLYFEEFSQRPKYTYNSHDRKCNVVGEFIFPPYCTAYLLSLSEDIEPINFHFDAQNLQRIMNGEGNGNPLQCSCLGKPVDRGAWQATVYGVARVRHDLETKQQHKQCFSNLSMHQNYPTSLLRYGLLPCSRVSDSRGVQRSLRICT